MSISIQALLDFILLAILTTEEYQHKNQAVLYVYAMTNNTVKIFLGQFTFRRSYI